MAFEIDAILSGVYCCCANPNIALCGRMLFMENKLAIELSSSRVLRKSVSNVRINDHISRLNLYFLGALLEHLGYQPDAALKDCRLHKNEYHLTPPGMPLHPHDMSGKPVQY